MKGKPHLGSAYSVREWFSTQARGRGCGVAQASYMEGAK